jgi:2-alkyl-3-oxoalkanoate reductase
MANTPEAHSEQGAQPLLPVVVLGATGYIGRRVVEALAASGWAQPVAVSRRAATASFSAATRTVALDATDKQALAAVLADAAGVVNCIAGEASAIVSGGEALLEAASRMHTPPRVVYLGSIAAYGSAPGEVDEQSPLLGDLGDYSASKARVDALAASAPFAVRLRPGIVYGPASPWWTDRIARLLVARRLGDLGDAGAGCCNLVHVDDVVGAILQALRRPDCAGQAYNLGSPARITWNAYFRQFAQALGAPPVRRISGLRLLVEQNVAGPVLKIREKLKGTDGDLPAIRPWLTTLCRQTIHMDVRKAEQQLGMRWITLDNGLAGSAVWFLSGNRT